MEEVNAVGPNFMARAFPVLAVETQRDSAAVGGLRKNLKLVLSWNSKSRADEEALKLVKTVWIICTTYVAYAVLPIVSANNVKLMST